MQDARKNSPASRNSLMKAISKSELYLPTQTHPERVQAGYNDVQVIGMQLPDGRECAAAFTSLKRLSVGSPNASNYLQAPCHALFQMLSQTPGKIVMVDPGSETAFVITAGECESLATGGVPEYVNPQTTRTRYTADSADFREVSSVPDEVLDAMRRVLSQFPWVKSAHLAEMQFSEEVPMQVVGFDCAGKVTEEQRSAIVQAVGEAYVTASQSSNVTFVFLDDGEQLKAIAELPAFYNAS